MNVCTLIHGYGRDRLPRGVAEPTPLAPEEREKIEDVLNLAENAQFALLEGLRALGDLMSSAAAEEIASTLGALSATSIACMRTSWSWPSLG